MDDSKRTQKTGVDKNFEFLRRNRTFGRLASDAHCSLMGPKVKGLLLYRTERERERGKEKRFAKRPNQIDLLRSHEREKQLVGLKYMGVPRF